MHETNTCSAEQAIESSSLDVHVSDQGISASMVQPPVLIAEPPSVMEPCEQVVAFEGLKWHGYRICGDNIDKTIRTRYMCLDKRNASLHYFHSFAVHNRIDFPMLSDAPVDKTTLQCEEMAVSILPSTSDDQVLCSNLAILISRVLVDHMKFFQLMFEDVVERHIKHQFYKEMSSKSIVVSFNE